MSRLTYRHTIAASYLGYITQAIVNNLAPLLFVTFIFADAGTDNDDDDGEFRRAAAR